MAPWRRRSTLTGRVSSIVSKKARTSSMMGATIWVIAAARSLNACWILCRAHWERRRRQPFRRDLGHQRVDRVVAVAARVDDGCRRVGVRLHRRRTAGSLPGGHLVLPLGSRPRHMPGTALRCCRAVRADGQRFTLHGGRRAGGLRGRLAGHKRSDRRSRHGHSRSWRRRSRSAIHRNQRRLSCQLWGSHTARHRDITKPPARSSPAGPARSRPCRPSSPRRSQGS